MGRGARIISRTVPSLASPCYQDSPNNYCTCTAPRPSPGDPAPTAMLFAYPIATAAYADFHTGAPQAALNRLAS